ncbi:MAG: DUF4393 domain-containing protein, partial [Alphaproteobacteria bacterium]
MIGGPAIEALRFAGHNDELRDLFENVLATSMDKETAANAHPAFVQTIKQLTPDEARILRYMARSGNLPMIDLHRKIEGKSGYRVIAKNVTRLHELVELEHPEFIQAAIDNLCRLEILNVPHGTFITQERIYDPLMNLPEVKEGVRAEESEQGVSVTFDRKLLTLTVFGEQFIEACVVPRS